MFAQGSQKKILLANLIETKTIVCFHLACKDFPEDTG